MAALALAIGVSDISVHAGSKTYYDYKAWQQQQLEQQRQQQEALKRQQEAWKRQQEAMKRQQEQQRLQQQQQMAKQQQEMAARQRQMQQQIAKQQQQAQERANQNSERVREFQKIRQQQLQIQTQSQQRASQEGERQRQLQRALEQQQQIRLKRQQEVAPKPRDGDDDDSPPDTVATVDPDQGASSGADTQRPAKHNQRSRHRHRPPSLPNTALETRPAPVAPVAAVRGPVPDSKPRPSQQVPASLAGADAVPSFTPPPAASAPGSGAPRGGRPAEIAATHLTTAEIEKAKSLGFKPVSETVLPLSNTSVQTLRAPSGVSADQARTLLLQQMPLGKFTVNHTYHIFNDQEGEVDKRAPSACTDEACMPAALINWNNSLSSCTKDVRIGIIDTSFDLSHPAFRELKVSSGQFLGGEQPSPLDWHGTAVLSLLAGDPHSGTPGLIPDAHFLLATAFRTDANGNASTDSIRLVSALEWLEKLGVQYVNMSFSGPRDPMVEAVIQRMRRDGVIFIAAAGNQGPVAPPSYPAAYPDVIAVTAVNRKGENYRHANRGTYIDVAAPGVDVLAALPDGRTGYRTGTSFAAPFVTAIVATQQAATMSTRAVWKPELLSHMTLRDLGPPGPDPIYGQGLALAPPGCSGPPSSTIAAGDRSRRQGLPPPMGAGGPTVINTSGGADPD